MNQEINHIAAGVVLYNPNENWLQHVESYVSEVDALIIIDNSLHPISKDLLNIHPQIQYEHYPQNIGVAAAINRMLEQASQLNCTWLMTMDQDSYFNKNEAKEYIRQVKLQEKHTIGVGPSISHHPIESTTPLILISSAMCIRVKETIEIGGMKEELFIDQVDHFFCLQVQAAGFNMKMIPEIVLQHSLGESRNISNKQHANKTVYLHNPTRLYYMTRNVFYLSKHFNNTYPVFVKQQKVGLFHRIKNRIKYETDRWETLKMVLLGILHFYQHKMGKLQS